MFGLNARSTTPRVKLLKSFMDEANDHNHSVTLQVTLSSSWYETYDAVRYRVNEGIMSISNLKAIGGVKLTV